VQRYLNRTKLRTMRVVILAQLPVFFSGAVRIERLHGAKSEKQTHRETRNIRSDDDLSKNCLAGGPKANPKATGVWWRVLRRSARLCGSPGFCYTASWLRQHTQGEECQNRGTEPYGQELQHHDRKGLECVPPNNRGVKRSQRPMCRRGPPVSLRASSHCMSLHVSAPCMFLLRDGPREALPRGARR
jgi:hypothetical protein